MKMQSNWNILLGGNADLQTGPAIGECNWWFLIKVNIYWPLDPAVLFLGIYLPELKTSVHMKTWMQIFLEVLLTLTKY